jgi:DNA-binding GntR family transcriptional regulator
MQNTMDQDPENLSASSGTASAAEPRLLAAEVVERLRDMIIQGELAPGVKLNERVLCERLRTSRTPVREAIKYLASEGLVELLPNRGAIVTPITAATVREMFELLGALEALAGELACVKASDADIAEIRALHYQMLAHHARGELAPYFRCNQEIHMRLVECAGNATLANSYRALNGHVRRARYMANLSRERWDHAVEEHQKILDALTRRDGALLPALLRSHLSNKMAVVMEALAQQAA